MATSPTTSVLGLTSSASTAARTSASSTSTAPAKDRDTQADKPSFSAALQDAQDPRPAPEPASERPSEPVQKTPATAAAAAPDPAAEPADSAKNPLDALKLLKDAAAKGAAIADDKGNLLPLDGESLPTTEIALATTTTTAETDAGAATRTSTARKLAAAAAASAQTTPLVAASTTAPVTPVLPENAAGSAAAALANSRAIGSADGDESGAATGGVGDATTSPKREIPASSQTLNLNQVAMSDSSNQSAASVELGGAEDLKVLTGSISPRLTSEKSTDTASGITTFGDTLKQIDSSMASPATSSAAVDMVGSSARDTGVRQYLDTSATTARVDLPVGKPGWSDAVADKVMWMSSQNINSAEIHLNPPDLGPLSVRVSTHHDQTSVFFTSSHATVRDALDQSLPRLREMMEGQGIQLLDAGVGGQGSTRQQAAQSEAFAANNRRGLGADESDDIAISGVTRAMTTQARPGLLDAYA